MNERQRAIAAHAPEAVRARAMLNDELNPERVTACCPRCGAGYSEPHPATCTHPGCALIGEAVELCCSVCDESP